MYRLPVTSSLGSFTQIDNDSPVSVFVANVSEHCDGEIMHTSKPEVKPSAITHELSSCAIESVNITIRVAIMAPH